MGKYKCKCNKYGIIFVLIVGLFVIGMISVGLNGDFRDFIRYDSLYLNGNNISYSMNDGMISENVYLIVPLNCNRNTMYHLQRLLCMHLFLSTMIPKGIYISISGINSSSCVFNDIQMYSNLFDRIQGLFNGKNVDIKYYLHNISMNPSENKNYLINKISKDNQNIKHNNIIISNFDSDDITHPKRIQVINHIYNNIIPNNYNVSILHRYIHADRDGEPHLS